MSQFRNITRRLTNLVAVLLLVIWQAVFAFSPLLQPQTATAAATPNPSANLDQYANSAPAGWQNGNLNGSNSAYKEGDSVPFRMILGGMSTTAGNTHTLIINWDTSKDGKHAYDYLTSFDRTAGSANPCTGVVGCGSPTTFAIPDDPNSTVTQVAGNFTIYNGTITSLSAYSLTGSYAGTSSTSIAITFTATSATPVIAWGGHIGSEADWGIGNGAGAVDGAPYHMRLTSIDGEGGNQDRSLQAAAVIQLPNIVVTKYVDINGDGVSDRTATAGEWSFVLDGGSPVATNSGGQVSYIDVSSGVHTITESGPSGFSFISGSGNNCTFVNGVATATVASGNPSTNATCSFTNGPVKGSISIVKDAVPNSLQDFGFTATGVTPTTFTLDDDNAVFGADTTNSNTKLYSNLVAGSYTFTESAVSGWDLKDISCPNASITKNITNHTVTVSLSAGDNVICTFRNEQRGRLVVTKQTLPDADPASFSITASGTGTISGNTTRAIKDDGVAVTYEVTHGTYGVTEATQPGWSETGNDCTSLVINGNTPLVGGIPTRSCTITNTKLATINIFKDAQPIDAQDFEFSVTNLTGGNFLLDDDTDNTRSDTKQFANLTPGQTYSVTELGLSGWTLTNLSCDEVTRVGSTATVTPSAGQIINCTFTNTKHGSIGGYKYEVDADGTGSLGIVDWTIYLLVGDLQIASTTTDENGFYSFSGLLPDNYTVSELLNSSFTQIYPLTNAIAIELDAGEDSTGNNFGNFENASISGYKFNDHDGLGDEDEGDEKLSGWTITISGPDDYSSSDITDEDGYSFTKLAPGSYTVCEEGKTGWVQTFPDDADDCHTVVIDESGETENANFGNQGRGNIVVDKVTLPTEDPETFDFTTTGNDYEKFSLTDTTEPNDQELAAGSYSVSEDIEDGWDLTYAECFDGDTQVDSSNITLEAGHTVTCTFTNTKQATVNVTKYNDYNLNGTLDEGEPTLEGWEMLLDHINNGNLGPDSETTNDAGVANYRNVVPGIYSLSENLASQEGWNFSDIDCDQVEGRLGENNNLTFSVGPGQVVECSVGNYQDLELNLTKANNRPAPTTVGDTVTYTLTLTLPTTSGASFNTQVIDLPPEGFEYVAGSWTAVVTHADGSTEDLKISLITPDPSYGSPGAWLLGTLLPGDTVVMTYRALITGGVNAGTYPDLAFASGCDIPVSGDVECGDPESGSTAVLANATSPDPFVATNVTVAVGQVLAANVTRTLYNTGTETTLIQAFSALLLACGLALGLKTYRNKEGGTK